MRVLWFGAVAPVTASTLLRGKPASLARSGEPPAPAPPCAPPVDTGPAPRATGAQNSGVAVGAAWQPATATIASKAASRSNKPMGDLPYRRFSVAEPYPRSRLIAMCPWKWTALGLALCVLLAAAPCQDPTVESAIAALGPEDRGVSPGPLHRPGQPCVLCHGDGGTARTFVVAGTIYRDKGRPTVAPGAKVLFLDADGHGFTAEANCAGNFYVEPRQWAPRFPLWVTLPAGNYTIDME